MARKSNILAALKLADKIAVATESFKGPFFAENGPVNVKFWFGENFKSWVLPVIPEVIPAFTGTLRKHSLTKSVYDSRIWEEIGDPTPFSVSEFASVIRDLLTKQPNGEEDGPLLANGFANIFYVRLEDGRVVAVHVHWYSDDREWGLNANDLDGGRWRGGRCVFSRS